MTTTRSTPVFAYGLRAKVSADRLSLAGDWLTLSDDFVDALNERAAASLNGEPDPQAPYDPEWKALRAERDQLLALVRKMFNRTVTLDTFDGEARALLSRIDGGVR